MAQLGDAGSDLVDLGLQTLGHILSERGPDLLIRSVPGHSRTEACQGHPIRSSPFLVVIIQVERTGYLTPCHPCLDPGLPAIPNWDTMGI